MEKIRLKTLDERITQDLNDLFNGKPIMAANDLSNELFGEVASKEHAISTEGMPGYYAGDRNAKTVMVMLNPGVNAKKKDDNCNEEIRKSGIDKSSLEAFINSYHSRCHSGVEKDLDKDGKIRIDNFDIKQAAFLKDWLDSGVTIHADFPCDVKEARDVHREVRVNVLKQKLQLELVPYASQKFSSLGREKLCYLFPYLETVLDEIFRVDDRKYVIFCSKFFERLLKSYSKELDRDFQITLLEKKSKSGILSNGNVYCTTVKIVHQSKELIAIIAHTFPNQSLPNAYDKMQQYGNFCYECWLMLHNQL